MPRFKTSEAVQMPEQRLAAAVLAQAQYDAAGPLGRERQRATAFLTEDGELLRFWCALAGVSVEIVRAQARRRAVKRFRFE